MARTNQSFSLILLNDTTGLAWSGQTVELYKGVTSYSMTEIGTSGSYKITSIPPDEYTVYVNSSPTTRTVAVGAGAVDSVDRLNNPNSNYTTDANGDPELEGPNTVVTSVTVDGVSSTGDVDLDAVYVRVEGSPTNGNIPKLNTTTKKLEDSNIDPANVAQTNTSNDFTESQKINGATHFGRLASEPTGLAGGDAYFNTTDNIGYQYNGTDWLQVTAGASFGQLKTVRNATAQTGFTTSFQKVTQFTTNGIEEGGVTVDLVNDEIDLPSGIWEISFSNDMTTTANNVVMTLGVFDITDTGFTTPFVERERKIGTGSDIGSMGGSAYVTLASATTIAMYGKSDASTSLTLKNASLTVIRIK